MSTDSTDEMTREEIYEEGLMQGDNRCGFGDWPAIVAIDLQYGETDPQYPMGSDLSDVIGNTNELVDLAHEKDVPVVWTRVVYRHDEALDAGMWTEKMPAMEDWIEGRREVEMDDRIHIEERDHVLDKRHASSFHETELNSMLNAQDVDTVIITGCSTSACVRETAADASAYGYHSIVPETCVGDRSDRQHEAHLFDIDAKFADVEPTDRVAEYLRSL
ncbi:MAG: isochorismatase family protein [Haloferacaceae archaeon]